MCSKDKSKNKLLVRDCYSPCEVKIRECHKMQEVVPLLQDGLDFLPVYDYSNKFVGVLEPNDFLIFVDAYFENLKFGDRGNEFVFESFDKDAEIHFVPIDQVSRYVNRTAPMVSLDTTVENAKQLILKYRMNAIPVKDGLGKFVGSISLHKILDAKTENTLEPCEQPTPLDSSTIG